MRAVILILSFFFYSTVGALAEECGCDGTDAANFYTTVNPDDAVYMEDFVWQIVSCEPVYDLRDANEPVVSYNIKVNFVTEDNPALDSYELDADENEKVLVNGEWMRFEDFERSLTPDTCTPPTS